MHCTERELSDYILGLLPDERADSVAEHLSKCAACDDTVEQLASVNDTVIGRIRGRVAPNEFADEAGCRQMLAVIKSTEFWPTSGNAPGSELPAEDIPVEFIREYQLLEKLGEGGMGAVYKALHTKLGRFVALKVLTSRRLWDANAIERFQREMQAVGKLDHRHLVQATDAGEHEGIHYLVMELVDGIDLSRLARRIGRLKVADACELMQQAARGLQEIHRHGMVHRDVKPSNLMLARGTRDNEPPVVKLLDLGLALLHDDDSAANEEITASGQLMGTIDYMAPEQLADSHAVDIRADVYSLGATLFKLLSGQAPFAVRGKSDRFQQAVALSTEDAPSITTRRNDLPQPLVTVIDRMLSRDAADRYAIPQEVIDALQPFVEGADLSGLLQQATKHPGGNEQTDEKPGISKMPGFCAEHKTPVGSAAVNPDRKSQHAAKTNRRPTAIIGLVLAAMVLLGSAAFYFGPKSNSVGTEIKEEEPDVNHQESTLTVAEETHDIDRKIARWALNAGSEVTVFSPDERREIVLSTIQDLPSKSFRVRGLLFIDFKPSTAEFAALRQLEELASLRFINTLVAITDRDVDQITKITTLERLYLPQSPIRTDRLRAIAEMEHINDLVVACSTIDDDGLEILTRNRKLLRLSIRVIDASNITEVGIRHIAELPELEYLALIISGITDRSLIPLRDAPKLRYLKLVNTRVSGRGLSALKECKTLRQLTLFQPDYTTVDLQEIATLDQLEVMELSNMQKLTDADLLVLASLQQLKQLIIRACPNITEAGITDLRQALPSCDITHIK